MHPRLSRGARERRAYTHAAVWTVMAVARLGSGDEAMELFHMLNPINHSRTAADADRYRTEPYVLAGDVYSHPAHPGRGGWSWYTGAAGWLYRTGLESLLGLRREGATFTVDPCIPASWPEYTIAWRPARRATSHVPILGTPVAAWRRRSSTARPSTPRPSRSDDGGRQRCGLPGRGHTPASPPAERSRRPDGAPPGSRPECILFREESSIGVTVTADIDKNSRR